MPGDPDVGLPKPHAVLVGQAVEALDGVCSSLASVGKLMFLGCTVVLDRDPLEVLAAQCPAGMRHPQALGQQQLQFAAEPLTPMAQVGALMRKPLRAGKTLPR